MNELSDQELLRDYAERQSEPAFAELVRRHVDFVYSAALRMVSDVHTAEDVTQNTFIALTKNALQVRDRSVLSSWLHSTARNLAANSIRTEVRRREREKEAAAMNELLVNEPEAVWKNIAPHLDDAIAELGDADRDALLLRYFERKSAREMGQIFGTSEEAAQKRVTRAVERLRELFSKRGIAIGATGLVVVISANAVHAAPAATVSTAAVLAGATIHSSTAATTTKAIAMTLFQKTVVTAAFAIVATTGIYEARQAAQLREQNRSIQQRQILLDATIQQLQREREETTNQLAALIADKARLQSSPHEMELLKLRGEVARLKAVEMENDNGPTKVAAKSFADRVAQLKRQLDQWPGKKTPEIELLTEQDFLDVAAKHQLESEADCRDAMSEVRTIAIEKFADLVKKALGQYSESNDGQFPSSPTQLISFLNLPPDTAMTILNGYAIAQPGTVHPPQPGPSESEVATWAMVPKDVPADAEYDHTFVIYTGGWYYYGPIKAK